MTSRLRLRNLKKRAPQLLILAAIAFLVLIIFAETLEDTVIERGSFKGTPLDMLLNVIVTLTQNVTAAVASWGYSGIFLLMLLESSSLPIPSEVVLPFAGYLVSQGQLNLWITILVSTLAGIIGSLIDYYIGMKGTDLLVRQKTTDRLFFRKGRLDTVRNWFKKYGATAVFLCRMVPGFRTLISFPAGAVKMPLRKFVGFTGAGCLVWNTILVFTGYYVGSNWPEVAGLSSYLIVASLVFIAVAFTIFALRKRSSSKQESN